MMGIAASHVRCVACGSLTEIGAGETAATMTCRCGATGSELAAVALVPCPDAEHGDARACRAEHDPTAGAHIVEVD